MFKTTTEIKEYWLEKFKNDTLDNSYRINVEIELLPNITTLYEDEIEKLSSQFNNSITSFMTKSIKEITINLIEEYSNTEEVIYSETFSNMSDASDTINKIINIVKVISAVKEHFEEKKNKLSISSISYKII